MRERLFSAFRAVLAQQAVQARFVHGKGCNRCQAKT
jgi:hypothetical protein